MEQRSLDIREPSLRQHHADMTYGSKDLLRALWTSHPRILRHLTGRMS